MLFMVVTINATAEEKSKANKGKNKTKVSQKAANKSSSPMVMKTIPWITEFSQPTLGVCSTTDELAYKTMKGLHTVEVLVKKAGHSNLVINMLTKKLVDKTGIKEGVLYGGPVHWATAGNKVIKNPVIQPGVAVLAWGVEIQLDGKHMMFFVTKATGQIVLAAVDYKKPITKSIPGLTEVPEQKTSTAETGFKVEKPKKKLKNGTFWGAVVGVGLTAYNSRLLPFGVKAVIDGYFLEKDLNNWPVVFITGGMAYIYYDSHRPEKLPTNPATNPGDGTNPPTDGAPAEPEDQGQNIGDPQDQNQGGPATPCTQSPFDIDLCNNGTADLPTDTGGDVGVSDTTTGTGTGETGGVIDNTTPIITGEPQPDTGSNGDPGVTSTDSGTGSIPSEPVDQQGPSEPPIDADPFQTNTPTNSETVTDDQSQDIQTEGETPTTDQNTNTEETPDTVDDSNDSLPVSDTGIEWEPPDQTVITGPVLPGALDLAW